MPLFYLQLRPKPPNKNAKHAELTGDVICHKSNSVWGCKLSDCRYINLCNWKVNRGGLWS